MSSHKLLTYKEIKPKLEMIKKSGKKIVFTYGTYDLIHSGHAAYLLKAKKYGDVLVVGIASNRSKIALRGKGHPLIDERNRAELLSYFDFVDYVIIADERNLLSALKTVRPDVFYTLSKDWKSHLRKPEEQKYVKSYGGRIIKNAKSTPYVSASEVVERVADLKIKEVIEYFFGKVEIDLSKGNWMNKKWSGLKTKVRSDTLYFGDHTKNIDMFLRGYYGEMVKRNEIKKLGDHLRQKNKKIVLSSGACDLVHAGHARFFKKAKSYGDIHVLAIPSNNCIRKLKGRGRPIVDQYSRAELMGFFEFIDYTVIFDEDSVLPLLEELKPNVFFTVQEDWNNVDDNADFSRIKNMGVKIVTSPPQSPNLSSSKLIRKAAGLRVRKIFKEVLEEAEKWDTIRDRYVG